MRDKKDIGKVTNGDADKLKRPIKEPVLSSRLNGAMQPKLDVCMERQNVAKEKEQQLEVEGIPIIIDPGYINIENADQRGMPQPTIMVCHSIKDRTFSKSETGECSGG